MSTVSPSSDPISSILSWITSNKSHILAIAGAVYAGIGYLNDHDGQKALGILAACGALSSFHSDNKMVTSKKK